jgi:threonylcarbamoyladenosine tRNA methylthiotransferase MtaB
MSNKSIQSIKIAFYTLGCKLNFAETSNLARLVSDAGYTKVDFSEEADIYIINTCYVTGSAEKKCRHIIHQTHNRNKNSHIIVMGCFSQLAPNELKNIEGVSLVIGNSEKKNLLQYIKNIYDNSIDEKTSCNNILNEYDFFNSYSSGDRTRAFLKVQDGCDYYCSYCTIPLARGHSRSGRINDIIESAKEIGAKGIKEIVLTGVNIGDFGKLSNEKFIDLLYALEKVNNIERFRISSIEPNLITEDIIAFVQSSSKFLPHFHIPLQSGSDKILNSMKRKYDTTFFKNKINNIKSLIPHACIAIDVITGFPSETNDDFINSYNFIKELDISYMHVFTYSERKNTLAYNIEPKVPLNERHIRTKELIALSEIKKKLFYTQNIGRTTKVLFEHKNEKGFISGFTDNYIKVRLPYNPELINKIIDIKITEDILAIS